MLMADSDGFECDMSSIFTAHTYLETPPKGECGLLTYPPPAAYFL